MICVERCAGERVATEGSRVRLAGRSLDGVDRVRFNGADGPLMVAPSDVAPDAVEAVVPAGAKTGRVQVIAYAARAQTPAQRLLEIVAIDRIPDSADFNLTAAEATPRTTYFDAARPPQISYLFQGAKATAIRVDIVDLTGDRVVRTLIDEDAVPNARNTLTWDGRTGTGALAPSGEYGFEVASAIGGPAESTARSRFGFYRFRFPIAGRHSYGDGFGAGRDHQGQDVFGRCGAPLRAARGGRVVRNDTQRAAGNYLVIDGKQTGLDFVYAHLRERSPLREGARVRTGQLIGAVGESGNASGCHLHFEAWSTPGWYNGGSALPSVRRMLESWDAWS